jgi:hypothetical protein
MGNIAKSLKWQLRSRRSRVSSWQKREAGCSPESKVGRNMELITSVSGRDYECVELHLHPAYRPSPWRQNVFRMCGDSGSLCGVPSNRSVRRDQYSWRRSACRLLRSSHSSTRNCVLPQIHLWSRTNATIFGLRVIFVVVSLVKLGHSVSSNASEHDLCSVWNSAGTEVILT